MRLEKEELNKILNTKLIYRDSLNLPSNVSFGIEIESDRVSYNKIKEKLRKKILIGLSSMIQVYIRELR